ncbi:MAG: hypothetical protein MSH49_05895 [[Eubacterium] saphenum]|nr:hypothetical protein [[Eubacterium] saphenum]
MVFGQRQNLLKRRHLAAASDVLGNARRCSGTRFVLETARILLNTADLRRFWANSAVRGETRRAAEKSRRISYYTAV